MYQDKAGNFWKYKLVWQENKDEWCTAYGNGYTISGSFLIFSGSHGDIVLSHNITTIIK